MNNTPETKPSELIKTGDIFLLGEHRLACGDAMDVPEKLFDQEIKMILTDPPYGVAYVENKEHFKKTLRSNITKAQPVIGDQKQTEEEYAVFTQRWLDQAKDHLSSYNTAYIFNSDLMMCALRDGMKRSKFYYSQMIIWVKNSVVLGRKDYLPQHELIIYGWFGRHKMERGKDRSVMFYPKPNRRPLHPTMKPVGLLRKIILNSTRIGDIVYDPFGGSGSTLIACEHTTRKCVMVETDPGYCVTIINRWEKLTKKKATKL